MRIVADISVRLNEEIDYERRILEIKIPIYI